MQPTEQQRARIEEERGLAQALYPDEWRETLSMPGRRRRVWQKKLRSWAVEAKGRERVAALGGTCSNCEHLLNSPAGLQGSYCDLDSDFRGYTMTKLDDLCSRWTPQASEDERK